MQKTVAVRVLQTAIDAGAGAELFIDRLPETFFILHCKDPPLRGRNRDHQIFRPYCLLLSEVLNRT